MVSDKEEALHLARRAEAAAGKTMVVNDAVHSVIQLEHPLPLIVDTPQFQRLRSLKQLGLADRVYPSATHSRFEHSLGVCFLAGQLVRSLMNRQPELGISEKDLLCIQIAALCHDLGHGPFSHFFDGLVLPRICPESPIKHEDLSVSMLQHMLDRNPQLREVLETYLDDKDFSFIKELIEGTTKVTKDWDRYGRGPEKGFLFDVVSNQRDGFDVDKYDYFLRDSLYTGFGIAFNHSTLRRLIDSTKVLDCGDGDESAKRICYPIKMIDDLFSVGRTRYLLHNKAYRHKTCMSCELMMSEVFEAAADVVKIPGSNSELRTLRECIHDMSAFEKLTDGVTLLIQLSTDPKMRPAQALLRDFESRRLPKYVGSVSYDNFESSGVGKKEMEREILECDRSSVLEGEDVMVEVSKKHHGRGTENPLSLLWIFNHKDPSEPPRHLHPVEFPGDIPQRWETVKIYVFSRSSEQRKLNAVDIAFTRWCQLSKTTILTPVKRRRVLSPEVITPPSEPANHTDVPKKALSF